MDRDTSYCDGQDIGVPWRVEQSQEEGDCIPNLKSGSAPKTWKVSGYWLFDGLIC